MKSILVVGNGESRLGIKLPNIETVGCNAIHRDHTVDHLVCCDKRMVEEALKNPQVSKIYTRQSWLNHFKQDNVIEVPRLLENGVNKVDKPEHWGSGPYSVLLGSMLGDYIHLIGFDLYHKDKKINNVYKGTENYLSAESKPVDYSYWVYQIAKVFCWNPDKYFTVYNTEGWKIPSCWNLDNVKLSTDLTNIEKNIKLYQ